MINSLYDCFKHWSKKGSVYLISDTHFDDIDCKFMDPNWITPEEHIKRIKEKCHKNDTLIHLGDVGNPEYFNKLNCYKVLIMGNHDQSIEKYRPYFNEVYSGPLIISKKIILSHEPVNIPWAFNIHGHEHNRYNSWDNYHFNLASNVVYYLVYDLNEFIKDGWIKNINSIHRLTIDNATKNKIDKG